MKKVGVIGVPSSAGARRTGQEQAPRAFREASLIQRLRSAGLSVADLGDLPEAPFRPDKQNPKAQNLQLVVDVAERLADRVEAAVRDGHLPIVLGGDCTIALGVLAGVMRHTPNLGLMYFDGDLDLNTPDTTVSGIFDGMVMAHMIGRCDNALARVGPRYPLLAEENIALFGYNPEAGWTDDVETQVLAQCRMMKYPAAQIMATVKPSAIEALAKLESKVDSFVVHFDVDVIDGDDFPAGDVLHNHGISFDDAMAALSVFTASPKFAGMIITEFNVDRDTDGALARRFVDAVANALRG